MAGTISLSLSQQFDELGKPLAEGRLYFYRAGTTSTPQNAYYDAGLTLPFPNPYTLDDAGRIPQFFLADGSIKVVLIDRNGVVQISADNVLVIGPSSGGGGGGSVDPTTVWQTGDLKARYGTGVHTGFVRANGRTIGSATSGATELANASAQALFLHLWAEDSNLAVSGGRGVSAAADWSANKTIATPDWRGRAMAFLDDMGNSAAGRLTSTYFGTAATVLGAAGGAESKTLTLSNLPTGITSTGTLTVSGSSNPSLSFMTANGQSTQFSANAGAQVWWAQAQAATTLVQAAQATGTVTSNNTSGTAHAIASPMMLATIYMKL